MSEHERELTALGRTIRRLREERGMSAAELAAAAGIAWGRLETIEAGRSDLRYDVLVALAAGLGVELSVLVIRAEGRDPAAAHVVFGRRLRALREERGFSREALGRRTGLHRTGIEKVENGTRDPRLATILRLARGLGVKPGELVEGLEG